MHATPRWTAYRILTDIEQDHTTLDRRMDRFRRESRFDRRDEAFVTALVYGVLRWRRRVDGIIDAVSTTPRDKIDRDVLSILRMGVYQMIAMDRVPPSAAVHTSVELTKMLKKKWLAGFVNAVLRNALRRLPDIENAAANDDPARAMALEQSFPDWMVKRWIDQFGQHETARLCGACNRIPPLTLRTNTLRTDRPALLRALGSLADSVAYARYAPEGIVMEGLKSRLFTSRVFAKGWFQVQDEAAQAVSHFLGPKPGQTVLDACAGLGGKTAHLAALMRNGGVITAVDRDRHKIRTLGKEMQRLGIDIVAPLTADLLKQERPDGLNGLFDRILLDAPCSGMGVIRRNPDTKWVRTREDIHHCAQQQRRLLAKLAAMLKPDGMLVYAVCTTEPEETHGVIKSFLKDAPDFAIDDQPAELPPSLQPLIDRSGCLLTLPHRHGTDGFFAVRLRRSSGAKAPEFHASKGHRLP